MERGGRDLRQAHRAAPAVRARGLSAPLTRLGLDLPPELLDLLRHGRGVDNRRLKRLGFDYRYTSAGTVADFVEALRLRR